MRWLIYALGGGAGHLTRAYALARPAVARGDEVEILAGGSFSGWLAGYLKGVTVRRLAADLGREVCAAAVRQRVRRRDFDRLIVDTFPRGLVGELAEELDGVRVPRVLVARPLRADYGERPEVRAAVAGYDLVLEPDSWLVRDAGELLSEGEARRRLGAPDGRPVAMVLGTGTHAEAAELAALTGGGGLGDVHVCYFGPERPYWPALELHAGVDVVVAAAGWNTVTEARACGTPLLARVRGRTYDDQGARVRADEVWRDAGELAGRLRAVVRRPAGQIRYCNGAREAVARIDAC